MLVYRITIAKYSKALIASGGAARWNPKDVRMIYATSSRSLACLENVVHRTNAGLNQLFNVMTIDCPESVKIQSILLKDLPQNWADFDQMYATQSIGLNWLKKNDSAILKVPSSIIAEEFNYLLNPDHPDFAKLKLISSLPFVFDKRIKP